LYPEVEMALKRNVLVVANVTATSVDLQERLAAIAAERPSTFTLVVPATAFGDGREAALQRLGEALEQLRGAGLEVEGDVGDADPIIAVTEAWDPRRYDEIIVSTLPMRFSKWLHAGLPERIGKLTGAPVTHVVSQPPKPEVATVAPPEHEKHGLITPLYAIRVGQEKRS
jgi:GABA permease